uniref:Uncharacterized protein n=1 Tax=Buteo japonicus TaxID=224669 RepID=A0A8C0B5I8_9AVES
MPLSAQISASGETYVLAASLDNARHLSSLLRAVHFQDHATCFATANGLRVAVEDAKCIQANAFIQVGAACGSWCEGSTLMRLWSLMSVLLKGRTHCLVCSCMPACVMSLYPFLMCWQLLSSLLYLTMPFLDA